MALNLETVDKSFYWSNSIGALKLKSNGIAKFQTGFALRIDHWKERIRARPNLKNLTVSNR